MPIEYSIDWMSITMLQPLTQQDIDCDYWRPVKRRNGYQIAEQNELLVVWLRNQTFDRMKEHLIISGTAMRRTIARHGETHLIELAANNTITRIDLAVDFTGDDFKTVYDVFNAIKTQSKKRREIKSLEPGDNGHTCYVGSAKSDKMIRVYDKQAEAKLDEKRTRLEVQLKGKRAQEAIMKLKRGEKTGGMIRFFTGVEFIPDEPVKCTVAEKETDTQHWLLTVVAPTLAREIKKDAGLESAFWFSVQAAILDKTNI